jgi:hypothetical protein
MVNKLKLRYEVTIWQENRCSFHVAYGSWVVEHLKASAFGYMQFNASYVTERLGVVLKFMNMYLQIFFN